MILQYYLHLHQTYTLSSRIQQRILYKPVQANTHGGVNNLLCMSIASPLFVQMYEQSVSELILD